MIALSAISTAFGLVFMIIGAYFPTFDLSCLFMSSIMVMLPLSKKSVKGAFLTYGATVLLSLPFVIGKFDIVILYALFFGLHPLVNYYQIKNGKEFGIITFLKVIWFVGVLYFAFYLLTFFTVTNEFIYTYLPIIIAIAGIVFFIIYDFIMIRFQKTTEMLIKKLKL